MAKWIDFSGARPSPHSIKDAGASGVLRYLSAEVPSTAWKRASKHEIHSYLAAGLDAVLNFEYYEGRMLEGAAAGYEDGKTARKQAKAIGYPKGASIYFSHDTSARNDSAVLAYMRAAQRGLGSDYYADIYSGYDVVKLCLDNNVARYGWQTLAWSYGRVGKAHLYQNGHSWFNGGADENKVLRKPLGSWLETSRIKDSTSNKPSPVKPVSKPDPSTDELYTVVRGDTLNKIAKAHDLSAARLVSLNKAHYPSIADNPSLIQVGWKLVVGKKKVETTPAQQHKPSPVNKPAPVESDYEVVAGDSLYKIAEKHNTTISKLIAWNKDKYSSLVKDPNRLVIGWKLKVK